MRGTQNNVADSVSRMLGSQNMTGRFNVASGSVTILLLTFREIVQMQGQDSTPKTTKEALERGEQRPEFTFKKNIFYCEVGKRGEKKIVTPAVLTPAIFYYYPVGAHLGIFKTIQKKRQAFVWKSKDADIKSRIRR
jgi:hypothetical protein